MKRKYITERAVALEGLQIMARRATEEWELLRLELARARAERDEARKRVRELEERYERKLPAA